MKFITHIVIGLLVLASPLHAEQKLDVGETAAAKIDKKRLAVPMAGENLKEWTRARAWMDAFVTGKLDTTPKNHVSIGYSVIVGTWASYDASFPEAKRDITPKQGKDLALAVQLLQLPAAHDEIKKQKDRILRHAFDEQETDPIKLFFSGYRVMFLPSIAAELDLSKVTLKPSGDLKADRDKLARVMVNYILDQQTPKNVDRAGAIYSVWYRDVARFAREKVTMYETMADAYLRTQE